MSPSWGHCRVEGSSVGVGGSPLCPGTHWEPNLCRCGKWGTPGAAEERDTHTLACLVCPWEALGQPWAGVRVDPLSPPVSPAPSVPRSGSSRPAGGARGRKCGAHALPSSPYISGRRGSYRLFGGRGAAGAELRLFLSGTGTGFGLSRRGQRGPLGPLGSGNRCRLRRLHSCAFPRHVMARLPQGRCRFSPAPALSGCGGRTRAR